MVVSLLKQGAAEIRRLRSELNVLRAVDATVRAFGLALNAEPPRQAISPDIAWEMEVAAQEERDAEKGLSAATAVD